MATIAQLNVRLGLQYQDFDRSLQRITRDLERSGRRLSSLGNDLSLSVSLPLAALGASALKQAGEIESLKLAMVSTFETAGRSAAEATAEVEYLRKSALAPGLDFEQAVAGSIRLQGVGYSAEDARKSIEQMANAIALTGGTAQNLDSVTVQFSQMIAKGKVLAQDLRIIQENMPIVSRLMQQAFGTQNAEALQKMGISGKQFVDKITEAAVNLPRVEGGLKNAFVNAAAEARNSLAKLGDSINKAFDVKGIVASLTNSLAGAVAWFDGLSDSTKSTIVYMAGFVAALGPVIKIIGVIKLTLGQGIGLFGSFVGALKAVASAALFATSSLNAFKVSAAIVSGGLVIALLAVAGAAYAMSDSFDAAKFTSKAFSEASSEVRSEASKEIGVLNKNIDALKDVRTSTDDRKKAADALLKAYPGYLQGIDIEKASLQDLNKIQKTLNGNIIAGIAERKKASVVNTLYEKQADILLRIQEIQRTGQITVSEAGLTDLGDISKFGRVGAVVEKLKAQIADIGKQATVTATDFDKAFGLQQRALDLQLEKEYQARASAEDLRSEYSAMGGQFAQNTKNIKDTTKATDEEIKAGEKRSDVYKKVLSSIDAVNKKQAELGADFVGEKTREIEAGVEKLIEAGFGPGSAPVQKLKGYLKHIRAEISAGFGAPNATQAATGIGPAAPAQIATLPTPGAVGSLSIPGADQAIEQARKMSEAWEKAGGSFDDFAARIESKKTPLEQVKTALADLKNGTISWVDALNKVSETYSGMVSSVINSAASIAANLLTIQKNKGDQEKAQLDEEYAYRISAAQGNADETARLQQELAAKKAAIDKKVAQNEQKIAIVKAVMDTAGGVVKALGSAPPPYNFILAALTAAAGAVQIATIKSQKFAGGVVATKPTFGMFGEYPGAQRNPEIVTPERLMRSIFRDESANAGGMVQVYGTIRGADILLSSEKATRERGRYR